VTEQRIKEAAVAQHVLDTLRAEGFTPEQVMAWCNPTPYDEEFEQAMQDQHGIAVSAAAIKQRVALLVTGTEVN
jgi:hypothetical protein